MTHADRRTKWLVTADKEHAKLMQIKAVAKGRWRAEEIDSIQSTWGDYHQHRKPDALDAPPSVTSHQHRCQGYSEMEDHEMSRRFARDIRHWLERTVFDMIDRPAQTCCFAAAGLYGELRKELEFTKLAVALHEKELTHIPLEELVDHPAIRSALRLDAEDSLSHGATKL